MKKRIFIMLAMALLIAGMVWLAAAPALADGDGGMYSIIVQVKDLTSTNTSEYNSGENSEGWLVVPTQKQDGSAGTTWYAHVAENEWDTKNGTWYYRFNGNGNIDTSTGSMNWSGNTPVEGFPTEVRLVKTKSPAATDYMTNDNSEWKTRLRFTIWVLDGDGEPVSVQSWEETTRAGRLWSNEKTVDDSRMPSMYEVRDISGETAIEIPMPGTENRVYTYNAEIYDQYGHRWYTDTPLGLTYSISGAPQGMNFGASMGPDRNKLTVYAAAADNVSTPGDFTVTISAKILGRGVTKTAAVAYPRYSVKYYSDGKLYHETTGLYRTTWTHTVANPRKAFTDTVHYDFTGWDDNGAGMEMTGDKTFTATFSEEAHRFTAYSGGYTTKVCGHCGYQAPLTVSEFLPGSGTAEDPFVITTGLQWEHTGEHISNGGNVTGKYFRLDADIRSYGRWGSSYNNAPFDGILDGNGHTVTVTLSATNIDYIAPICYIKNATIRNLKTAGTIYASEFNAGLVGRADGTNLIENCEVGTTNTCSSGTTYAGGILGNGGSSNTTIRGCVYKGTTTGASNVGTIWGWSEADATPVIENCMDVSDTTYPMFAGLSATGEGVRNTYYTSGSKTQGTWANNGRRARSVTVLNTDDDFERGEATVYSASGITGYAAGNEYGGVYYLGEGETLLLKPTPETAAGLTNAPGGKVWLWKATEGKGTITTGNAGFTLHVGDSDCEIMLTDDNPFQGDGSEENPFQIGSSDDWNMLAAIVGLGYDCDWRSFALTDNITVTEKIGTGDTAFMGNFDGAGHTLDVNLSGETAMAPFHSVGSLQFKNLKVTGTISGGRHSAGLFVTIPYGGVTITNVEVAATITTSDQYCGGFIGHGGSRYAHFRDCVFSGNIAGATNAGTFWGWSDSGSAVYMTNCLDTSSSAHPIGRGSNSMNSTIVTNTYYTYADKDTGGARAWGEDERGKRAYTVSYDPQMTPALAEGSDGILRGGVIYAAEGDKVKFTADWTQGTVTQLVFAREGEENVTLTADADGVFTLTMPAGNGILTIASKPWEFAINAESGFTYADGVLTITAAGNYTISAVAGPYSTTADRIVVSAPATVTLNGLRISTGGTALTAAGGSTIKISGYNSLTSGSGYNGFATTGSGQVTITDAAGDGSTEGTLDVYGTEAGALGDHITIAGGKILAYGTSAAGTGLTVTGGQVILGTRDYYDPALPDGNLTVAYPAETKGTVFTAEAYGYWWEENGAPYTGSNTLTGIDKSWVWIQEWECAPQITITDAAAAHLTEIRKDYETIYQAGGAQSLADCLSEIQPGFYNFIFDYPYELETGGTPGAWRSSSSYGNGEFSVSVRMLSGGTAHLDTRSDAFYVIYQDADGTELYREPRYPGLSMRLYAQPDQQGRRFRGWKNSAGETMPTGYVTLNEATTLTADWETVTWHTIEGTAGIQAVRNWTEVLTWANTGDNVTVKTTRVETPTGKYCTGYTINGAASSGGSFVMPDTDVILEPVYADGTDIVFDLTGDEPATVSGFELGMVASIAYDWGITLENGPVQGEGGKYWYNFDLNGDGTADVYAVFDNAAGNVTMTRLAGADSLTRNYRLGHTGFQEVHVYLFMQSFSSEFVGSGTQEDPWQIGSTKDWRTLGELTEAGEATEGKYFRLTADIDANTMTGSPEKPFKGTFDGNGHTMNVMLNGGDGSYYTAPFRGISGATITNLTITGTVSGYMHSGGLAGSVSGTNTIRNCKVAVTLIGTGEYSGGFIGHGTTSATTLSGCEFSGYIDGISKFYSGSFWGWSDAGAAPTLTGCMDTSDSTCPIGVGDGTVTVTNVYYTRIYKSEGIYRKWSNRGKRGCTITGGEGITLELAGETGLVFNGQIYAGSEDVVSIRATKTDGTHPAWMALRNGDEVLLTVKGTEDGIFTFTMADASLTAEETTWTPGLAVTPATGTTYEDAVLTISAAGNYTITMAEGKTSSFDSIVISAPATVTLNNVTIAANGTALTAAPGSTIRLAGQNSLASGPACPGIATDGNGITITSAAGDGSTQGSLEVYGGQGRNALGNNITVSGGSIYANGVHAIENGLTVTGGLVKMTSGGNSMEAVESNQVRVNFPAGKKACIYSTDDYGKFHSVDGSPFAGDTDVALNHANSILIQEYIAPEFILTESAREHLVKIEVCKEYGSGAYELIYAPGDSGLDVLLGVMETLAEYRITFDYPMILTAEGDPEPEVYMSSYSQIEFAFKFVLYPGSRVQFDARDDVFQITYLDEDGETVLGTENRYPGQWGSLMIPPSKPGKSFYGWELDGEIITDTGKVGLSRSFDGPATLTAHYTEESGWYNIEGLYGFTVFSTASHQTATWAKAGTQLYVQTYTIQPPEGKYCTGWKVDGETEPSSPWWITMPDHDLTIEPVFDDVTTSTIDLTGTGLVELSYDDFDYLEYTLDDDYTRYRVGYGTDPLTGNRFEKYDINGDRQVDIVLEYSEEYDPIGVRRGPGADRMNSFLLHYPTYEVRFLLIFGEQTDEPDLVLPAALTRIEESAFEGDTSFTVVEIPEECTSIGKWAFKDCKGLKKIWIPEGCEIGEDAFDGCTDVEIFGVAGSPAEAYCDTHGNCTFVGQ